MAATELVTHSGAFHADEVMAGAVLKDLFPDARIIRSRDHEMIRPEIGRIVFDVGGIVSYILSLVMAQMSYKTAKQNAELGIRVIAT